MMRHRQVPLVRRFSPVPKSEADEVREDIARLFGASKPTGWEVIERKHRCVILAGAGAGKTHEMLMRARYAVERGRPAFFIRIEDVEEGFEDAFEIGSAESFERWLDSPDDAWFFLDSIDEARLSHPRAFERAVRRFADRIEGAENRAHVIISGRPYAWRAVTDRAMLERWLPFAAATVEAKDGSDDGTLVERRVTDTESALEVYVLRDLEEDDIRMFAAHHGVTATDDLIDALRRSNLLALAVARQFG
jgi:hypothetical protein